MAEAWGYINGKAVYSRDEFIFERRGFGEITEDADIIAYAEKVTYGWSDAGHHHTFGTYYLGTYCLDHPMCDMTTKEYERLKELQKIERNRLEAEDEAKEWKFVKTIYWADNSIEEIWINKFGEKKTVQVVGAHGDAC